MKILNASEPEFGGPMTEDEARNFLVNSKKNVHISTLDEKGEQTYILHGIILTITMTKFT
jgi:hypothetical protein